MKNSWLGSTISAVVAIGLFAGGFLVAAIPLIRKTALDGHTLLGTLMVIAAMLLFARLVAVEQERQARRRDRHHAR